MNNGILNWVSVMVDLGELREVPVRNIWRNETRDFTPWLAENLDRLSEAIGIRLDLSGTEIAVENFAADILARNIEDGSFVLIENQLEKTDHTHLGQILTYLAGLEAKTVIWISPDFQEPHLSAIRWLNEHTADDFSFFAVRLKVIRIGDSAPAVIFDVLERPSGWERALSEKRRKGYTEESEKRLAFWTYFAKRHPEAVRDGFRPNRHWVAWFPLADGDIQLVLSIGQKQCGVFVRGGWEEKKDRAREILGPYLDELARDLGAVAKPDHREGHVLQIWRPLSFLDEGRWDDLADWLEERRQAFKHSIEKILSQRALKPST